jgi:hypothetical protein
MRGIVWMRALILLAGILFAAVACDRSTKTPAGNPPPVAPADAAACQGFRDSSYDALYSAREFATGKVGFSGREIPQAVLALRCLTGEPDAVARLRDVIQRATMPGQLYALVALRLIDDREFDRTIERYRSSNEKVTTVSGDMVGEQPVAGLADAIAGGRYDVRLYPGIGGSLH